MSNNTNIRIANDDRRATDDTTGFGADYFLKIDDVKGEKARTIEIMSFSWGINQTSSFGSGR